MDNQTQGSYYVNTNPGGIMPAETVTYNYNAGNAVPTNPVEENKSRHIEIDQLNGGYTIRVGCHQFAFETAEKMVKHLTAYLKNPQEIEKKWFAKKLDLTK